MKKHIIIIGVCCWCMVSCIKDEALNKECDIESAWIEGKEYEEYFYKTTEMQKEISSAETNIVFSVRSLISLPTQIPLNFKITDGATIEPASGSMQDFTKDTVVYTVTSQDREWRRLYNVIFQEVPLPAEKYSFEHVEIDSGNPMYNNKNAMHVFYELMANNEHNYCWATGNSGSALTKSGAKPDDFPVYRTLDGKEGGCVCLNTQSAGMMGEWMKKPIAAGSLFLGKFLIDNVLTDALKATRFGVPVSKKPIRITGWYKYKPGEKFTDKDMNVYPDRKDEASIYAVYYRNIDDKGESYVLDGHAVEDLDKMLDNPQVYKVARVASLPTTDTWTQWEMFFEGRDAPDDIVAAQGCNLALVFSSSKRGAQFEGAVGSTLYVDEVEVSYEK
ncbi:MAG: PCMD domain-containing protein [Prevotella sp.]|nr:PCMD domain-containing protein [Prevotella sp.]